MVNCGLSLVFSGWLLVANTGLVSEALLGSPFPGFSSFVSEAVLSGERLLPLFAQLDTESRQPLFQRLDSETRGDLIMKLLLILVVGFALMLFAWMGARIVRRIGRTSHPRGRFRYRATQPEDDWWKKSMISNEDSHLPE